MKILYFLNCALLASALLASCENDVDENIVHLVNSGETDVVVTGVETEYGYPGEQFTIIGENFGGAKDFIKVSIGEKEAEIMSCSDQQIKAIVPKDATTGKIVVEFMDEIVSNSIQFRVMGNPEVLAMNPKFGEADPKCWGMPGGTITLYGNLLGGSEKDIEVLFGKTEAEIISWNENEIKIEIPEDVNDEDELTLNVGPKEVNMPYSFMLVHPLTVEKTLPAEGYAGCKIEVVGTGLGNDEILDQTHVWLGKKPVTINKEESDDNSLIVTLPDEMETGEYAIKVKTPFEEKESTVVYNVIDEPVFLTSDESGYVGNEINISATRLPSGKEYVSILVGDKEAKIMEYDTEDGTVNAKLPTDLAAGNYPLKFVYSGKEFIVKDNFELKAAPVIESHDAMVFSGGEMIIKGSNLDELKEELTLTFDGKDISPISVSEQSITFDVPGDITVKKDVNVKLSYQDDIIAPVKFSVTVIPAADADGDITKYVLENAGPDFENDGNNAAGWIKGSVFNGNSLYIGDEVNYLSFTGKANAWNASLYQNIILPRGKYQVEIKVAEDDNAKGRDGVVFAIMKGSGSVFPELTDKNPTDWHFESKENVICEYNLTENHDTVVTTHTTEEFTIDESFPLTLGFALMLDNNNYLRISEIKIKVVNE